ncbi:MAG: phenylacetate--CoA ligase family protein [Clostridiales bacterium]|nr:phenylacetate--CoA ligase family protein [Clostridiales bacterium]
MNANKILIEKLLFPAMETMKGNHIRDDLRELQSSQGMRPAHMETLQREKLGELLLYCVHQVPAYKDLQHLIPEIQADPFEAIKKFPILRKREFQENSMNWLADGKDPGELIPNKTGGSTGEPVTFYMDRHAVEYYEAARWRGLSWWGITPGSPSIMLWGNPRETGKVQEKKYQLKERFLKNRILFSAHDLDPEKAGDLARAIQKFKPEYLYGYASALYTMAQLLQEKGLRLRCGIKAVVSTAETLQEEWIPVIESSFCAPVVNEYGARDAGIIAYQCPDGGMHISAENVYVEVVDLETGEPVPPGTRGALVVTDLNNFSMPRLRWRLGDLGAIATDRCVCGRALPLLESLDGREDSVLIRTDGAFVHGSTFGIASRDLSTVRQFQVVQKSPEEVVIKLVQVGTEEEKRADQVSFASHTEKKMPGTRVRIEVMDEIPPSASGKFRRVIREF